MSEAQEVQEEEVVQEEVSQDRVDAEVLNNRIAEYTKQRDDHVQKAQALHGEIMFCTRMLDLIDGNGSSDS